MKVDEIVTQMLCIIANLLSQKKNYEADDIQNEFKYEA